MVVYLFFMNFIHYSSSNKNPKTFYLLQPFAKRNPILSSIMSFDKKLQIFSSTTICPPQK